MSSGHFRSVPFLGLPVWRSVVLFLLLVFGLPGISQSQVTKLWKANIKADYNTANKANRIRLDKRNNILLLNYTWVPDSSGDILLIKIDTAGNEIWRRVYDGPQHTDDRPVDMAIDAFNNIWVCATSRSPKGDNDILLLKYSSEGTLLNQEFFGMTEGMFDAPTGVAVDKTGFPSVCGYVTTPDSGIDYIVLRYLPHGSLYWFRTYATLQMDMGNDIEVDDSCNIYTTGIANGSLHEADILVLKYDSAGNRMWLHRYDGRRSTSDAATCMTLDDSADVYVSGYVNHSGDRSDLPLLKFTRNGMLEQEILFNGRTSDCVADRIFTDRKTAQVSANYTDYAQQESGSILLQFRLEDGVTLFDRKFTNGKYFYRLLPGQQYKMLVGACLYPVEGTLQPAFAIPDTVNSFWYEYQDTDVHGLAYIRDLLVQNNQVFFLGDDAGETSGTICLFSYSLQAVPLEKVIHQFKLRQRKK